MKIKALAVTGVGGAFVSGKLFAVIGRVSDLFKADLIFSDGVEGNEEKVLVIQRPSTTDGEVRITEFSDFDSAVQFVHSIGEKLEEFI